MLTSVASMASMASAQSCGDLASLAAFQVDDYGALDDADGGAGDDDEDIGLCLDEDEDDAETASVATRRSVATASPTGRRPSYDAFDLALKPGARGARVCRGRHRPAVGQGTGCRAQRAASRSARTVQRVCTLLSAAPSDMYI